MDLLGLIPAPSLGSGPVSSARLPCPRPRPVATPVPLCPASSTPETCGMVWRRRGDLSHLLPELRPQGAERPVARGTTLSFRTFHFISRGVSLSAPPERLCPGTWCFAPNFLLLYGAPDVTPMPWLSIFTDASCPSGPSIHLGTLHSLSWRAKDCPLQTDQGNRLWIGCLLMFKSSFIAPHGIRFFS